jgi:pyruvate-ferredoxin/flavodoxin oxidoreductase
MRTVGENPFRLDSPRPRIPLKEYAYNELRYSSLANSRPEDAEMLLGMAQAAVTEKYRQYEELASRDGSRFHPDVRPQAREPVAPTPPVVEPGEQRHQKPVLVPGE